jgi:biotin-(acetyl-CoA carboxylase) ligase
MIEPAWQSDERMARVHFPPLITPYRLRERQDAFTEAMRAASEEGEARAEAGSLFYVGSFELIEFAVVLEPAEPLKLARKIFYAGMNALADALSILAPPEKPINFRYPASLYFDGALVGGGRLGVPAGVGEEETPPFLVFGAMVRAGGMRETDGVMGPEITTLDDEGFDAWNPEDFSASFARHFLVEVDSWGERGMAGIGPRYLERLEGARDGVARRGIDTNGDLLLREGDIEKRIGFLDGLKRLEWFDPAEGGPRG